MKVIDKRCLPPTEKELDKNYQRKMDKQNREWLLDSPYVSGEWREIMLKSKQEELRSS